MTQAIAIVSGGLDSVTLAHMLHQEHHDLHLVSFHYGQRHKKELYYARQCAKQLHARFTLVNLRDVGKHLTGSALTDIIPVPEGHYAAPSMRLTVVPNRNAIMLAIAYGIAVAEGAEIVATGVHSGDHPIYPDCRPDFLQAFDQMERLATDGYSVPNLRLYAPFAEVGKQYIVQLGQRLGVNYRMTWSCYKGNRYHCGICGTCVERKEAFMLAGVPDPTRYDLCQ